MKKFNTWDHPKNKCSISYNKKSPVVVTGDFLLAKRSFITFSTQKYKVSGKIIFAAIPIVLCKSAIIIIALANYSIREPKLNLQ